MLQPARQAPSLAPPVAAGMVEFGGPTCQPGVRELLDGIALRAIQPGDEAWLHAIFSCTRDAERQLLAWPHEAWQAFVAQQSAWQQAQYQAQCQNPAFDLVLFHGQVAGRLYVDRRRDEIRVVDIALLPAFRGQGIGRRLLQALVAESDACGQPLALQVARHNPILAYYQRLGMQVQDDLGEHLCLRRPCRTAAPPSADAFLDGVGSDFRLVHPEAGYLATLRLERVQSWQAGALQGCAVHFSGPDIQRTAPDTYGLEHRQLGRFSLRLGPVQRGGDGACRYEALITRMHSPTEQGT